MGSSAGAHELEYRFDREFVRTACKRDFAWLMLYALGFLAVVMGIVYWLFGGFDSSTWIVVVAAAFFMIVMMLLKFRRAIDRTYELMTKQSPSGTMRFKVDQEGITVELDSSKSRHLWEDLRRLWRYRDVWLLEVAQRTSVMFPAQAAPAEMRDYIVERCAAAGIKV